MCFFFKFMAVTHAVTTYLITLRRCLIFRHNFSFVLSTTKAVHECYLLQQTCNKVHDLVII